MRSRADESHDPNAGGTREESSSQPPPSITRSAGEVSASSDAVFGNPVEPGLDRSPGQERLSAAARLIGDDSLEVRKALLREFRRAGRVGQAHLRRAAKSEDARVRGHARLMIEALRQQDVVRRLQRLAGRGVTDLESALFLLAGLEGPNLNARLYTSALDAMAKEVTRRTRHVVDDLGRGQALVNYLGTELGYRGNFDSYTHPDNIHLHRVIETKQGLPLSLCALYSFVAQRCSIHTGIVPLPGHVMLRLYGRHQNLIVDPFHGGESKSQEDLVTYLRQHGLRFDPVWMHDASPKMLLQRQIRNLRNSWRLLGLTERAARLSPLVAQLDE